MRTAFAALALVTVLGRRPINHPREASSRAANSLSTRAERRKKFVIHLAQAVTAFGGHSQAPLIITEIADAPDPAERYVELFTAGPFTPKWLSRSKSEIFTKTEKTSETVAITVTEDDLSPSSQFLLVCADRDAFVAKYDLACNIESPDFFEDFDGDVRVAIQEMVDSTLGPIIDKYGGFAINETLQHYYHAAAEAVASAASTTGKTASEDTSIIAATESSTSGSAGETDAEADSFVASSSLGNPEEDFLLGSVTNTIDVMAGTGDEQALSSSGFMNGGLIFDGSGAGAISTNEVEATAESGSVGAAVSSEMEAGVNAAEGSVVTSFTSNAEDYVAAGTDTSLESYTSTEVSGGAEPQGPLHTSGVVVSYGDSAANDAEGSFDGTMKGELGLDDSGGETYVENYVAGSAEAGQASAASDSLLKTDLYAGGDLAAADFYVGAGIATSCVESNFRRPTPSTRRCPCNRVCSMATSAGDASTDGGALVYGGAGADGIGAGAYVGSDAGGVSGANSGVDVKNYAYSTSGLGPGDAAYAYALGKATSDGDVSRQRINQTISSRGDVPLHPIAFAQVTEEKDYFPDRRLDMAFAGAEGGVYPGETAAAAGAAAAVDSSDSAFGTVTSRVEINQ